MTNNTERLLQVVQQLLRAYLVHFGQLLHRHVARETCEAAAAIADAMFQAGVPRNQVLLALELLSSTARSSLAFPEWKAFSTSDAAPNSCYDYSKHPVQLASSVMLPATAQSLLTIISVLVTDGLVGLQDSERARAAQEPKQQLTTGSGTEEQVSGEVSSENSIMASLADTLTLDSRFSVLDLGSKLLRGAKNARTSTLNRLAKSHALLCTVLDAPASAKLYDATEPATSKVLSFIADLLDANDAALVDFYGGAIVDGHEARGDFAVIVRLLLNSTNKNTQLNALKLLQLVAKRLSTATTESAAAAAAAATSSTSKNPSTPPPSSPIAPLSREFLQHLISRLAEFDSPTLQAWLSRSLLGIEATEETAALGGATESPSNVRKLTAVAVREIAAAHERVDCTGGAGVLQVAGHGARVLPVGARTRCANQPSGAAGERDRLAVGA